MKSLVNWLASGPQASTGLIGLHGFGRVDALQSNAGAGGEQQRVAVDDAADFVDAFFELLRRRAAAADE